MYEILLMTRVCFIHKFGYLTYHNWSVWSLVFDTCSTSTCPFLKLALSFYVTTERARKCLNLFSRNLLFELCTGLFYIKFIHSCVLKYMPVLHLLFFVLVQKIHFPNFTSQKSSRIQREYISIPLWNRGGGGVRGVSSRGTGPGETWQRRV